MFWLWHSFISHVKNEFSREEEYEWTVMLVVRIPNKAMMYTNRFPIGLIMSEDNRWSLLSLDKEKTYTPFNN